MTSLANNSPPVASNESFKVIFLILGLVCILGFAGAMLVAAFPLAPMTLEWRVSFMGQYTGRVIILFLGAALILYSVLGLKPIDRYVALTCLAVGVLSLLLSVLVVSDSLTVRNQTINNVEEQALQLETQIQEAERNPELANQATPEAIQDALLQISTQTETLKQDAQVRTSKAVISGTGSLLVISLGFLGLGRFGIRRSA